MKFLKTKNISKFSINDRSLIAYPDGNGPGNRVVVNAKGGIMLPKGTTAQRPQLTSVRQPTDANGTIRYNTSTTSIEAYVGGAWVIVASALAAAITKQTLGPGDGVATIFGPLNTTFAASYAASADNVIVLVENVMQISTTNFTINQNPTSTGTGGGSTIDADFQINIGTTTGSYGYGWGAGVWSRGGWGSGTLTPLYVPQRDWWFDNFDNDAVMNIRLGPIYYWEYDGTFVSRAVLLSSIGGASAVPVQVMQILVSQNDKHLLAFGAVPFGSTSISDFDPLLIRWADQDNPLNWTPSPTNSAGFIRVSRGSRIIRALPTRQETLVFTDSHLYSLQFTGTTDVFALQEMADNISIMSPRACTSANNVTYWMGTDKFYAYSGRVETLPCTLRNHVFQNFNYDQAEQVVSGTNEGWQEIWWFYPTANSNVNNAYVVYNYLEKIWHYGSIERTAWLDTPLREYPQAVGGNYVYDHERGVDDDVLPMTSFVTTNDFDVGDGENFLLIRRIIPDVDFTGSTAAAPQVLMTMRPRNFPGANYSGTNQPDVIRTATVPIEQFTEQVFIRARARQMGFKIQSTDLGVQWQLGAPRLDGRADGKR
jgi:hypothetical protein